MRKYNNYELIISHLQVKHIIAIYNALQQTREHWNNIASFSENGELVAKARKQISTYDYIIKQMENDYCWVLKKGERGSQDDTERDIKQQAD